MNSFLFRLLALSLFTFVSTTGFGQFLYAEIGVDGLTCSQCQRSVEMGIRKLDFVEDVKTDLANTDGRITFKAGSKVDVNKIAKAITDAGFSVRFIKAGFNFSNLSVNDNFCFQFEGNNYQFIKCGNQVLNGERIITFTGKKFMPAKEFKKIKSDLKSVCGKTGDTFFVNL